MAATGSIKGIEAMYSRIAPVLAYGYSDSVRSGKKKLSGMPMELNPASSAVCAIF